MQKFRKLLRIASLLTLAFVALAQRVEWDSSNFPNPTAGDFQRCNMKTTANLCDPDEVLTEQQRYRLNHDLHQLEARTRQDQAPDFCQKKGVTAAMAVVRHVKGGTEQAAKEMANSILRTWSLDQQCQKSVVIVLATEDRRFWVARDPKVPVYANEFTQIFNDQKHLFAAGDHAQALGNILQQTWEKALAKQGRRVVAEHRPIGPAPPLHPYAEEHEKGTPFWVWLLPLLLLPLLCCCCCCYLCCRKSQNAAQYQQSDMGEAGAGQAYKSTTTTYNRGGAGGGGGGGLNNFLAGLGGAGIGSMAGRFLGDRFGRSQRTEEYRRETEGYRPGHSGATTTHTTTKVTEETGPGLYPAAAVHDEGGGGSWK